MTASVVIPCFNHARFLAEAVESARAQTWPDVEVVVVDDGSSDGSGDIAARYAGVRVLRQPNRGLSHARNTGLAQTTGDVVIFLDADDRLLPDTVRVAVDTLAAHPEAALVFGACRLIDDAGHPLASTVPEIDSHFYERLLSHNFIWTPGMAAFRRRVFDTVGRFNPDLSASADYDMYLRVAKQFPFVRSHAVFAEYRQHEGNMSRDPVRMLEATLAVLRQHRPAAGAAHFRTWRTYYGEQLVERFRAALHAKRFGAALRDAFCLLRWYPAGVGKHLRKKVMLAVRSQRRRSPPPSPVPRAPLGGGA